LGLNIPSFDGRYIRSTHFPRIGRSPSDIEEISSFYDVNSNTAENEETSNENEFRSMEQRSVHFPRIGKRAFHSLLWENIFPNPHHVFDAEVRHHIHPNPPQFTTHYRGKRNLSM